MSHLSEILLKLDTIHHSDDFITQLSSKLDTYLDLLTKWNRAYNLTAILKREDMISRHILDSLAILPWINGTRVLDVGTGAGLPGLIIALARPDLSVTLLDSNGKKIRFLQEAKRVLAITNVEIIQKRVQDYQTYESFDTIVSRAFSQISDIIKLSKHLIANNGIWLAMKGLVPIDELGCIDDSYQVKSYKVPNLNGNRCCVIIRNK